MHLEMHSKMIGARFSPLKQPTVPSHTTQTINWRMNSRYHVTRWNCNIIFMIRLQFPSLVLDVHQRALNGNLSCCSAWILLLFLNALSHRIHPSPDQQQVSTNSPHWQMKVRKKMIYSLTSERHKNLERVNLCWIIRKETEQREANKDA